MFFGRLIYIGCSVPLLPFFPPIEHWLLLSCWNWPLPAPPQMGRVRAHLSDDPLPYFGPAPPRWPYLSIPSFPSFLTSKLAMPLDKGNWGGPFGPLWKVEGKDTSNLFKVIKDTVADLMIQPMYSGYIPVWSGCRDGEPKGKAMELLISRFGHTA